MCDSIIEGTAYYVEVVKHEPCTFCNNCVQKNDAQVHAANMTMGNIKQNFTFKAQVITKEDILDECIANLDMKLLQNVSMKGIHHNVEFWESVLGYYHDITEQEFEENEELQEAFETIECYEEWRLATRSLTSYIHAHVISLIQLVLASVLDCKEWVPIERKQFGLCVNIPAKWRMQFMPTSTSVTQNKAFYDFKGM